MVEVHQYTENIELAFTSHRKIHPIVIQGYMNFYFYIEVHVAL